MGTPVGEPVFLLCPAPQFSAFLDQGSSDYLRFADMAPGAISRRHQALSHFLRSRRARLSPQQVGLVVSAGKRRTPGLRREEVAVLAGIGTSWYTWLEQGRDIKVSEPIARAIGRALRLDQGELAYFYRLVGLGHSAPVADIADSVFEPVVNGWLPNPALVIDPLWNILA